MLGDSGPDRYKEGVEVHQLTIVEHIEKRKRVLRVEETYPGNLDPAKLISHVFNQARSVARNLLHIF